MKCYECLGRKVIQPEGTMFTDERELCRRCKGTGIEPTSSEGVYLTSMEEQRFHHYEKGTYEP